MIAMFFRKSASTPQAMNGSIATYPMRSARHNGRLPRRERERHEERQAERVQQHVDVDRQHAAGARLAGAQRGDERQDAAVRLDRCARGRASARRATPRTRSCDGKQDHGRQQVPHGERERQPRERDQDEAEERGSSAIRPRARRTGRRAPSGRGTRLTQMSHTTSTSSMMSACHTYWCAHSNTAKSHCPM